jgi:aerobic-type carbon monoxide dehydrogenase small subunit (CoxS/CutS family)
MIISFFLNGEAVETDTMPHRRTVDLLREDFQLRSLKFICGEANCGSCLILLDDRPVHSCILPAFELRLRDVWTMEGISSGKPYLDIVNGFKAAKVYLCGNCAPSRALATEALLRQGLRPTAEQVRETAESVRCSCTSTRRVMDGILRSARLREIRVHES